MRAAIAARGRDPTELGVVGQLRVVLNDKDNLDVPRTMAAVPELREAGVTDFRIGLSSYMGQTPSVGFLSDAEAAFRVVAG